MSSLSVHVAGVLMPLRRMQRPTLILPSPGAIPERKVPPQTPFPSPAGPPCLRGFLSPAIRLGAVRFQYCPVGEHWTTVAPVNPDDLTDAERRAAAANRDARVP